MRKKGIGRPTDSPKDATIKVRIDDQTKRMLEYCVSFMDSSKSYVIRKGIEKMYDEIMEGK